MTAKPILILALVIAAVLGYLVHSGRDTRDADLARIGSEFHRVSCDIINRQVSGSTWQVQSGRLFRDHSKSPEIRAFYTVNVPERVNALRRSKADQARLHCTPAKKEKP